MVEELYKDKNWRIIKKTVPLPDGRLKDMFLAQRPDGVHVLAFPRPGIVLMLYEYRAIYCTSIWMIPSGRMDQEMDPIIGANRELREETGFRAKKIRHYCTVRNSEYLDYQNHVFLAEDLIADPLKGDDTEIIDVHELPLGEAIDRVLNSAQIHTPSAFALLRYAHEHPSLA